MDRLIATAKAAHAKGRRDEGAIALHRAAMLRESIESKEAGAKAGGRIEEIGKDVDPLLEKRRQIERQIAARLLDVAGSYRKRKLPRAAVELLGEAKRFDLTMEKPLLQAEIHVNKLDVDAVDRDQKVHSLQQQCFHPGSRLAPAMFKLPDPREQIRTLDAEFPHQVEVRARCAQELVGLAREYGRAGLWKVAFTLATGAIRVEPLPSFPAVKELVAEYRESSAKTAAEQREAFWKQSTRWGRWKKAGKVGLTPPKLDDRPGLILTKEKLEPPYRVQVDIDLKQQPGGGGIVIAAEDAKNYLAVELNTIGIGLSVYLAHVVDGKREVIDGCSTGPVGGVTPEAAREVGEALYNAMRVGLPLTLAAEVQDEEIAVSCLLGELFRTRLPNGSHGTGSVGLVRVSYQSPKKNTKKKRRRRTAFMMEFTNLLVQARE